jgi:N-acyl-D-amino-acid deacylase
VGYDTVIRNGLIVDGTGAAPYRADLGILDGTIVELGSVTGPANQVVDAADCIVTPGFVDVHTHYDGQAIWSEHLSPSSQHGVTTAVVGNCGVGFAPCLREDHDLLVNAMEGVEDIPQVVMTEGLAWDWETFPDYLDALDSRRRDIDVAAYLPHSPLRVYAMGERGANRLPATEADIERMTELARQAVAAGAIGFATSRTGFHRRGDGEHIPSFEADEAELAAISAAMAGRGIMQLVTTLSSKPGAPPLRGEIDLMARVSRHSGVTITFSLVQRNSDHGSFAEVLQAVGEANRDPRVRLRPQFAPRPIGVHVGFGLSANPFSACPSYRELAELPAATRLAALRRSDVRRRIVAEQPSGSVLPIVAAARQFEQTYVVDDPPDYEPTPESSVVARAAMLGVSAAEYAYDAMLADDGQAMLYVALANYAHRNLDHVAELFTGDANVIGLGDGGAHYGMIADASYPTFVLTHWTQHRAGSRIGLATAVRLLAAVPAALVGLRDRGRIGIGLRADLNVIGYDSLQLGPVRTAHDLPAGGQRLVQAARGYRHTFVNGIEIVRDDEFTSELPGTLVRGANR